jgi:hypothetical protein
MDTQDVQIAEAHQITPCMSQGRRHSLRASQMIRRVVTFLWAKTPVQPVQRMQSSFKLRAADDERRSPQGFGWAIAKALAEAGAEISLGVWVRPWTAIRMVNHRHVIGAAVRCAIAFRPWLPTHTCAVERRYRH